jgi:hypothetical protein
MSRLTSRLSAVTYVLDPDTSSPAILPSSGCTDGPSHGRRLRSGDVTVDVKGGVIDAPWQTMLCHRRRPVSGTMAARWIVGAGGVGPVLERGD